MDTDPKRKLEALFELDRKALALEQSLLAIGSSIMVDALCDAVQQACKISQPTERVMRIRRLCDLAAQVPSDKTIDALITMLDDPDPRARLEAGEALLDVAYHTYKPVAQAIERRIKHLPHGPSLPELAWLLAEIGEPSATKILVSFFTSTDPQVIAAAIEALAILGDPAAIKHIEAYLTDTREVDTDDEGPGLKVQLSELAQDAIETLRA